MTLRVIAILVAAVVVSPSADAQSRKAKRQALIDEVSRTIPTCSSDADCKAKWSAAQVWVSQNAGLAIKTVTDVLIQTDKAVDHNPALAMTVTREPVGDGTFRIIMAATCDNIFGCSQDPWAKILEFQKVINAVTP